MKVEDNAKYGYFGALCSLFISKSIKLSPKPQNAPKTALKQEIYKTKRYGYNQN